VAKLAGLLDELAVTGVDAIGGLIQDCWFPGDP